MTGAMMAEWVIGAYTGAQAKSVKAHADAGIAYFVQSESGRGETYTVTAAFRRPLDRPRPEHVLACTPTQIQILERKRAERDGRKYGKIPSGK